MKAALISAVAVSAQAFSSPATSLRPFGVISTTHPAPRETNNELMRAPARSYNRVSLAAVGPNFHDWTLLDTVLVGPNLLAGAIVSIDSLQKMKFDKPENLLVGTAMLLTLFAPAGMMYGNIHAIEAISASAEQGLL